MTSVTILSSVISRADYQARQNPTLRYGQCLFNELSETLPLLANDLRGSQVDPYYKASRGECEPAITWLWVRVATAEKSK